VRRVLVTGMSGAGKSALLGELAGRGCRTADTDYGGYYEIADGERRWRADRIGALLDGAPDEAPGALFVSGVSSNQRLFYPRFHHVVLLSAPAAVLAGRLASPGRATVTAAGPGNGQRRSRSTTRTASANAVNSR
jgi:ribose 1,5-bisphosphokinase PhnN